MLNQIRLHFMKRWIIYMFIQMVGALHSALHNLKV